MITYPDIEQKTEAWFAIRYGKIGGTGSKSLASVKTMETILNELIAARMESFEFDGDSFAGKDAERGNDLEPNARAAAEEYLGIKFNELGWCQSELAPLIGYSPDGLTEDLKEGLEIKCPSAKVHIKYLRNKEVPHDYSHQIVHAFAVNPALERHNFVSFRPECDIPLLVVPVGLMDEINLGTEARPVMKMVMIAALEKRQAAIDLEKRIQQEVELLKF